MTETERLLETAQDIARRRFPEPSEKTVMDLFHELASERDRRDWERGETMGATMH